MKQPSPKQSKYCKSCKKIQPLLNVRKWPGQPLEIGECAGCYSTLAIKISPKKYALRSA